MFGRHHSEHGWGSQYSRWGGNCVADLWYVFGRHHSERGWGKGGGGEILISACTRYWSLHFKIFLCNKFLTTYSHVIRKAYRSQVRYSVYCKWVQLWMSLRARAGGGTGQGDTCMVIGQACCVLAPFSVRPVYRHFYYMHGTEYYLLFWLGFYLWCVWLPVCFFVFVFIFVFVFVFLPFGVCYLCEWCMFFSVQ